MFTFNILEIYISERKTIKMNLVTQKTKQNFFFRINVDIEAQGT